MFSHNDALRVAFIGAAASAALFQTGLAHAQSVQPSVPATSRPTTPTETPLSSAPASAPASAEAEGNGLNLDKIVVTGTSSGKKLFKAPYAITLIDSDRIADKAPASVADALKGTPGLWVESTAGAGGSENIYVRGLPGGSYQYFGLQVDGLPLFETQYETYLNADILQRTDLGTDRIEVVRGGTSPIYMNNAPGGTANFITNHGTSIRQGAAKVTTGAHGLARVDLTQSGPVADNLLMSVSGFLRTDNGMRNPGYSNGDRGGQLKVGATYLLPKGQLWGDMSYLNDRAIFYSGIPIANPATGQSLNGVINQNSGTLISGSMVNNTLRVLTADGGNTTVSRNLRDGIHPEVTAVTAGLEYDLGGDTTLSNKARYTSAKVGVDYFLNGQYVTGGANGFSAQAYANTLALKAAGAVAGRFVVAGTNTPITPTEDLALANNYVSARTKISDLINDLRLEKKLNDSVFGRHEASAGLYLSHYTFEQYRLIDTFLSTVNNNATVLDVQALNSAGQVLGKVTENGVTAYGNGANGNVDGDAVSLYGGDVWHISDDWQIDAGLRHERARQHGLQGVLATQALTLPDVLVPINVTGATSFKANSETLSGTAWTLGSQYQLVPAANAFVRYTNSYSFPRFQNVYAGSNFNGQPLPVSKINQAEGGLKFKWPGLSLFAVGFYSHFSPLLTSGLVQNAAGSLVNQTIRAETTNQGIELEANWSPNSAFSVRTDLTLQHSSVNDVQAPGYTTEGTEGKRIPRIPNVMAYVEPTFYFPVAAGRGRVFATITYVGDRYQDYNNLSRIPAYTTLDLGGAAEVGDITFAAHLLNVTNSTGLTEGNSRASAVAITPNTPVANSTIGRPLYGRTFSIDATWRW